MQSKAHDQMRKWNEQWAKKVESERKSREKQNNLASIEAKIEKARLLVEIAEKELALLRNTLKRTLHVNDCVDWNTLYDHTEFDKLPPNKPKYLDFDRKPEEADFSPTLEWYDKIIPALKRKKVISAKEEFNRAIRAWESKIAEIDSANKTAYENYQIALSRHESIRENFYSHRAFRNEAIQKQAISYFSGDPESIEEYCDLVLSRSEYPSNFPKEWSLNYIPETGILVIDYQLPEIDVIPKTKDAKYVKTRDEIAISYITDAKAGEIYDDLLYQICLRTIHEVFEADAVDKIRMIVFNGFVSAINKSTGNLTNTCVMSLQASKEDFQKINLAMVDPRECFKGLKGVGSSKLSGMAPVPPILKIDKADARFIEAYSVIDGVDESANLASMDWEDFEHLIREVFAAEFSQGGGEVHVTQASRDGGVDAIAFDPDPIRGGKIVIQAKRYTGTVGVGAVRDLYGTVMNEGATKGILVTTSNFGPDAYKFVKDKPLTLLSGANLLHLLEKHGRRARIDIHEARKELKKSL